MKSFTQTSTATRPELVRARDSRQWSKGAVLSRGFRRFEPGIVAGSVA